MAYNPLKSESAAMVYADAVYDLVCDVLLPQFGKDPVYIWPVPPKPLIDKDGKKVKDEDGNVIFEEAAPSLVVMAMEELQPKITMQANGYVNKLLIRQVEKMTAKAAKEALHNQGDAFDVAEENPDAYLWIKKGTPYYKLLGACTLAERDIAATFYERMGDTFAGKSKLLASRTALLRKKRGGGEQSATG